MQITEEGRIQRVFLNYQSKGRGYHRIQRNNWITGRLDDLDLTKEEEEKGEIEVDDYGGGDVSVFYISA